MARRTKTARGLSAANVRAWAAQEPGEGGVVEVTPEALRELADAMDRREKLLQDARTALVPHSAFLVGGDGKRVKNPAAEVVARLDAELGPPCGM